MYVSEGAPDRTFQRKVLKIGPVTPYVLKKAGLTHIFRNPGISKSLVPPSTKWQSNNFDALYILSLDLLDILERSWVLSPVWALKMGFG